MTTARGSCSTQAKPAKQDYDCLEESDSWNWEKWLSSPAEERRKRERKEKDKHSMVWYVIITPTA